MSQPKDWLDKLFTRTTPNNKDLQAHYGWQQGDTAYEWYGNGMLKSVRTPEGATIRFEYDALGRRTLKEFRGIRYRYAWDGNVLLHEWNYHSWTKPIRKKDKYGRYSYSSPEPLTNFTTWVYDGQSHTPVAKFTEEDCYSIVQDHLGTPTQAFDSRGNKVWDCVLDIYGDIQMIEGDKDFIPFRFQGQYADVETSLYYNSFRYYSPELRNYISQDPIRMAGNNPKVMHPHSFRHRYAKNFLEAFKDIALLADLMGHESIETTRIYLRRTASEQQAIVDKVITW